MEWREIRYTSPAISLQQYNNHQRFFFCFFQLENRFSKIRKRVYGKPKKLEEKKETVLSGNSKRRLHIYASKPW
ncbi:hypothetical protein L2E82_22363 [Cichorium intybus]|uniref:Uncharacterized protein n=1 Tax=Cichorium intybus TaxID=13427 RepID=A0ACB9DXM7_CICIN|nr:hypothetical protein L2E82_22363 [Cichorium intybus]